jgi:hypothetical protein
MRHRSSRDLFRSGLADDVPMTTDGTSRLFGDAAPDDRDKKAGSLLVSSENPAFFFVAFERRIEELASQGRLLRECLCLRFAMVVIGTDKTFGSTLMSLSSICCRCNSCAPNF